MTINIEDLRSEVKSISEGVAKIRESGITDDALIVLIQRAAPAFNMLSRRSPMKPTKSMIESVLEGIEGLEELVFGVEDEN